ncbi:MAG: GNAT family N-acetyltransferase [Proteobacteria bacterium]|nr:GNAT family N-acetyltransferase [Pseudomonadota bacterium]
MSETGLRIASAETASDLADIKALFRAYAASLSVDLAYQDFEAELATLPGKYAPPGGSLLLARDGQGRAIGCVALRPLDAAAAEMKRLYVAPGARGLGLGQALVHAVCAAARKAGYNEIRLDTLPEMRSAQKLYHVLGFGPVPAYYETPVAGTVFLGKRLLNDR